MQYIFLERTNEKGTEGAKKEKERRENVEETLMISLIPVSSLHAKHSSKHCVNAPAHSRDGQNLNSLIFWEPRSSISKMRKTWHSGNIGKAKRSLKKKKNLVCQGYPKGPPQWGSHVEQQRPIWGSQNEGKKWVEATRHSECQALLLGRNP